MSARRAASCSGALLADGVLLVGERAQLGQGSDRPPSQPPRDLQRCYGSARARVRRSRPSRCPLGKVAGVLDDVLAANTAFLRRLELAAASRRWAGCGNRASRSSACIPAGRSCAAGRSSRSPGDGSSPGPGATSSSSPTIPASSPVTTAESLVTMNWLRPGPAKIRRQDSSRSGQPRGSASRDARRRPARSVATPGPSPRGCAARRRIEGRVGREHVVEHAGDLTERAPDGRERRTRARADP